MKNEPARRAERIVELLAESLKLDDLAYLRERIKRIERHVGLD